MIKIEKKTVHRDDEFRDVQVLCFLFERMLL